MLTGVYQSYKRLAEQINWKSYSINELFFKCIEHEHDTLNEPFYAGIICRVWGYSGRIYTQCQRHVPFDECLDCVIDAINYVLKKRVWENKNSSLYQDPTAPDKAFHIALKRQKGLMLSAKNAQKRVSNFDTVSIDSYKESYSDAGEGLLFGADQLNQSDTLRIYISSFFENGNPVLGLMLDTLCYTGRSCDLDEVVRATRQLNMSSYYYFNTCYNITERQYKVALGKIKRLTPAAMKMKLKAELYSLRSAYGIN